MLIQVNKLQKYKKCLTGELLGESKFPYKEYCPRPKTNVIKFHTTIDA